MNEDPLLGQGDSQASIFTSEAYPPERRRAKDHFVNDTEILSSRLGVRLKLQC